MSFVKVVPKDMVCQGFQLVVGLNKDRKPWSVKLCRAGGFHYCDRAFAGRWLRNMRYTHVVDVSVPPGTETVLADPPPGRMPHKSAAIVVHGPPQLALAVMPELCDDLHVWRAALTSLTYDGRLVALAEDGALFLTEMTLRLLADTDCWDASAFVERVRTDATFPRLVDPSTREAFRRAIVASRAASRGGLSE